jgi:hypothetical protein
MLRLHKVRNNSEWHGAKNFSGTCVRYSSTVVCTSCSCLWALQSLTFFVVLQLFRLPLPAPPHLAFLYRVWRWRRLLETRRKLSFVKLQYVLLQSDITVSQPLIVVPSREFSYTPWNADFMRRKTTNKWRASERPRQISERQPAGEFRTVIRRAAISKSCGSVHEMCWLFSVSRSRGSAGGAASSLRMENPGFGSSKFSKLWNWAAEREVWVYRITLVCILLHAARNKKNSLPDTWNFPQILEREGAVQPTWLGGALYLASPTDRTSYRVRFNQHGWGAHFIWRLLQTAPHTACPQNYGFIPPQVILL